MWFYYKELVFEVPEGVYYPQEDSLLLAKVIESLELKGKRFLDLGCGCGFLAILAAKKGAFVCACDVNKRAVHITKKNAEKNGVKLVVKYSNLFSHVKEKFDIIVFNAPYLPVKEQKMWSSYETIERFLKEFHKHLLENGFALLLVSSITELRMPRNVEARIMVARKIPWETLQILKLSKRI